MHKLGRPLTSRAVPAKHTGLNATQPQEPSYGGSPTTSPELISDGPEVVPGALELMRAGFEPLESLTGAAWISQVWPEDHRSKLHETRKARIIDPSDEDVWFIRSPWPGISTEDALSIVWANLPRDDEDSWYALAGAILAWPASKAVEAYNAVSE